MAEALGCRRERRAITDRTAFRFLIAAPAVGAFGLPANARIHLLSRAGCAEGTVAATIGSRTIGAPLLSAGGQYDAGWFERGKLVTPQAGFDVLIDNGLGKLVKVGGA